MKRREILEFLELLVRYLFAVLLRHWAFRG